MKIELIKAAEADKDFLLDLRKKTMVKHLEKAGIYLSDQEHLARVNIHFEGSYLIMVSGQKAGVLKRKETKETIEILQFQVSPDYQRKGIARYLIENLAETARSENKILTLKVLKDNPAKYLYERSGFKIVGEDQYEFYMKCVKE